MPKGTTAEERLTSTLIPSSAFEDVDDVERAFEDWREGLSSSTEPGKVRAFELQMDERGMVSTTRMQIRLGSWPIDSYGFDDLCAMIVNDFMDKGASRMAVRLVGSRPGQGGVNAFNKIVILKRRENNGAAGSSKETVETLMKAIQDNNERMLEQFKSMIPSKPQTDVMDEMKKMLVFSQMINGPTMDLMKNLLPALVGRPPAAAVDPFASFSGVIDLAGKIADLKSGGGDGGGDSENDWVNILRAVGPIAKSAVEALPHVLQARPAAPALAAPQVVVPQPAHPLHNPAPAAGTAQPAPGSVPSQPSFSAQSPGAALTDIPTGDHAMFAQLKPQIDALVTMAKEGADPVAAADMLFENVMLELDEGIYSKVAELIAGGNFVKNAAVFNPAVTQYLTFFEAFRAQIVSRVEREDAEAGQTPSVGQGPTAANG